MKIIGNKTNNKRPLATEIDERQLSVNLSTGNLYTKDHHGKVILLGAKVGRVETVAQLSENLSLDYKIIIVTNEWQQDIFFYNPLLASENNGTTIFNGWVRKTKNLSDRKDFSISMGKTDGVPEGLQSYVEYADIFIDNFRGINLHTAGDVVGQHTVPIPNDKMVIREASRSIDYPIGKCKSILFIGDSLTAKNDGTSFIEPIVRKFSHYYGGLRQVGYIPFFSTVLSIKHSLLGIGLLHSGFTDMSVSNLPYDDVRRKYSPDGHGFYLTGNGDARYVKIVCHDLKLHKYDSSELFFLKKPGGGTFTLTAKGASATEAVTVDTDGVEGLGRITISPNFIYDSIHRYDIEVSNIVGEVVVYGINFIDSSRTQGVDFNVFAQSGKTLWEYLQLSYSSLAQYLSALNTDTIVLNLGTNDSSQGKTPVEFEQNMNTFLNRLIAAKPGVKIVLITPNNMQWTNMNLNYHREYESVRRKIALERKMMYIDITSELVPFNSAYQYGWMKDGTHPNAIGSSVFGGMVFQKMIRNCKEDIYAHG